jgi:hypothetical protein
METSLHRQLKLRYARDDESTEVIVGDFRIDAIAENGELIEIQHASLGALRRKSRQLLDGTEHHLRIVKPIVVRKRVTTLTRRGGKVKRSRMSPLRGDAAELFLDLVHFSDVFPSERLELEFLLVEAEELRIDRKAPTRRRKKYSLLDQRLLDVLETVRLRTIEDLLNQVPLAALPIPFDTAELAAAMQRPRWFAQKVAYCLRKTGGVALAGKRGNSLLYAAKRSSASSSHKSPKRRYAAAA